MHKLHPLDIAIIFAYLIICLIIGYISSRKITNIKEYALGTGNIPTVMLVATMLATHIGAGPILGTTEKTYSIGLVFLIAIAFRPLFWLITAEVFAKNISYFKEKGCISSSDIMGLLYGKTGRWATNLLSVIMSIFCLTMQITAIGYILNYFLGIPNYACAIMGFSVLVLYSVVGGARTVVITDVFQAMIFFVGIPVAFYIAFKKVDNIGALVHSLPSQHTSFNFSASEITLLISLLVLFLIPDTTNPFIQRYLMANNRAQLKKALKITLVIYAPFIVIIGLIGYLIRAMSPDIEPNMAFFELLENYLPSGMRGLLIVGLLAAVMSTADSWLNSTGVLISHDIIARFFPKINGKQEVHIAKFSILAVSGITAFLALSSNQSIISIGWLADNFWSPIILVPIIAGFFKFRTNSYSFVSGSILGVSLVVITKNLTGEYGPVSMVAGMIGSIVGLIGCHYVQQKMGMKIVTSDPDFDKEQIYTYSSDNENFLSQFENFSFKNFVKNLKAEFQEQKNYYYGGIIGTIYFLISLFLSPVENTGLILFLKAFAACLCINLLMYEYIFNKTSVVLNLYYYLALTFTFPFISIYILMNFDQELIWIANFFISFFIMYLLTGPMTSIILSALGGVGAYILILNSKDQVLIAPLPNSTYSILYLSILLLLLLSIFRNKDKFLQNIIEAVEKRTTSIAHDVKQPLSYVYMCADIMVNTLTKYSSNPSKVRTAQNYVVNVDDFDSVKSFSKDLKYVAEKGTHTVNNILNISRSDFDKAQDIGEYDISEIVKEALKLHLMLPQRAKRINVNMNNNFKVKGSKYFISEAISNIIENSMKYAGSNAVLDIWCEGRNLHLRDDGVGMEADKLSYIFNKYKHMDGKLAGTGLGMHFCKRVIEAYRGSIKASSTKGEYMEFILMFPD